MELTAGVGWPSLFESILLTRLPPSDALRLLRACSSRVLGGRVGSQHEHDTDLFSPPRSPLRFDLDNPFHPRFTLYEC